MIALPHIIVKTVRKLLGLWCVLSKPLLSIFSGVFVPIKQLGREDREQWREDNK